MKSRFVELGFNQGIPALVANLHPVYNTDSGLNRIRQALEGRVPDYEIVQALENVLRMLDREDDPSQTVRKLPNQDVA
jgi:hypothetical protein